MLDTALGSSWPSFAFLLTIEMSGDEKENKDRIAPSTITHDGFSYTRRHINDKNILFYCKHNCIGNMNAKPRSDWIATPLLVFALSKTPLFRADTLIFVVSHTVSIQAATTGKAKLHGSQTLYLPVRQPRNCTHHLTWKALSRHQ
jgi:hypothetical protein